MKLLGGIQNQQVESSFSNVLSHELLSPLLKAEYR